MMKLACRHVRPLRLFKIAALPRDTEDDEDR